MAWVCPSVCHTSTTVQNRMSKGNKGNQPELQLAALTKWAVSYTSIYYRGLRSASLHSPDKPVLNSGASYMMRDEASIVHV
jgi:hypothetical protein